ncbi:hypothetical protein M2263_001832 [Providencia alcalifaciens]|nr:hypothetical protein [Providencia alcalifaciens]
MFKSLLTFDKMITPKVITILYWLSLVAILLTGISNIVIGLTNSNSNAFIYGFFIIIFGGLSVRISCELIMLSFNIYGKLKEIAENTKPR